MSRRALIPWTTGAAAAAVLVVLGPLAWRELELRRACDRAREGLLGAESLDKEPPAGWGDLRAASPRAFAVFSRLLADDGPLVWTRAIEAIDLWHEGARKPDWEVLSRFQEFLRDDDPVAWLRYQLPGAYQHSTDWRNVGWSARPAYWSGRPGQPLAPSGRALRFIGGLLAGKQEGAFDGVGSFLTPWDRRDLEDRAVNALRAMLSPTARPSAAVELLRSTAAGHRFGAVRLAAVRTLASAFDPLRDGAACLERATWFADDDPPAQLRDLRELAAGTKVALVGLFHADHRLELLAHVDSASILWLLVMLREVPELREELERALGPERGSWPVPKPAWLPLEAAGARHLASASLDERAAAVLALVELGTPAAREALTVREARESHQEMKLLLRSGRAALGDEVQRSVVERELLQRLDGPLDLPEGWLWCARGAGEAWAPHHRIATAHLCRHLLLAGSRATLERLVQILVDSGQSPVDLSQHVEGWPLPALQVSTWWQEHGARLRWDAGRRKFRATQGRPER